MTIDELNQQSRLLNEFFAGVQEDQPIPEVDPTELRRFHENMSEQSREAGPGAAIALSALRLRISATDAGPLCVRNWLLGIMLMQGLLPDWQQGTELDGSVFRVAATIPVNWYSIRSRSFRYAPESGERRVSPTHRSRWGEGEESYASSPDAGRMHGCPFSSSA